MTAPLPALVFTVAITGHRDVADRPELRAAISTHLSQIAATLRARAAASASAIDAARPIELRLLSALAEGADQIALDAAPPEWRRQAVLPFDAATYRASLADASRDGFDRLAATAQTFALADWRWAEPPSAQDAHWRQRRYATLGQLLVARADLVLALWRGTPPAGPGGTADVVAAAARAGVPVVALHPDTATPPPATGLAAPETAIEHAVAQVLLGDTAAAGEAVARYQADGVRAWRFLSLARAKREGPGTGAALYALTLWLVLLGTGLRGWPFATGRPRARGWTWLFRPLVQRIDYWWDGPLGAEAGRREALAEATAVDAPLAPYTVAADAVATRLGHHYRSAYIAVFALAALAVALAYVFASKWKPAFVAGELLAILAALVVWLRTAPGRRWGVTGCGTHQRWLDARLIAENLRGARLLSWIGMSGRRVVRENARHDHGDAPPLWAPHFANAAASLPDLPAGDLTPARIARVAEALGHVLDDQAAYHRNNHRRLARFHHRLDAIGLALVGIAALASMLYLSLWALQAGVEHPMISKGYAMASKVAAFVGGAFPAAAAALAGIRFQGDFERFAARSARTEAALTVLAARAAALQARAGACGAAPHADAPLIEPLTALMLDCQGVLDEDLADWRFAYAARPIPLP